MSQAQIIKGQIIFSFLCLGLNILKIKINLSPIIPFQKENANFKYNKNICKQRVQYYWTSFINQCLHIFNQFSFLSISCPCALYHIWSDRGKRTFSNIILLETNKGKNWLFLLEAKEYSEHKAYLQVLQAM